MKTIGNVFGVLFYTIISVSAGFSFGQEKTITQLQTELVSPWLVTMEGEDRPRTLRIAGSAPKADGTLILEATYGFSDAGQSPISASASRSGQEIKLLFTTQLSGKVTSTRTPDGSFEGTMTYTNGKIMKLTIQKISEDELQVKVAAAQAARAANLIVKPAMDVPAQCAAFSGRWTGTWGYGVGQQWLWVTSIDNRCMAKVAYLGSGKIPSRYETVEIKDGVLEWLCNKSTSGACVLKRNGTDLWASYSNPSGGYNNAVFTKIE
jgi:hypothetical protein